MPPNLSGRSASVLLSAQEVFAGKAVAGPTVEWEGRVDEERLRFTLRDGNIVSLDAEGFPSLRHALAYYASLGRLPAAVTEQLGVTADDIAAAAEEWPAPTPAVHEHNLLNLPVAEVIPTVGRYVSGSGKITFAEADGKSVTFFLNRDASTISSIEVEGYSSFNAGIAHYVAVGLISEKTAQVFNVPAAEIAAERSRIKAEEVTLQPKSEGPVDVLFGSLQRQQEAPAVAAAVPGDDCSGLMGRRV